MGCFGMFQAGSAKRTISGFASDIVEWLYILMPYDRGSERTGRSRWCRFRMDRMLMVASVRHGLVVEYWDSRLSLID